GLLKEGAHEKSPKCLGREFRGLWGILQRSRPFLLLDKSRKLYAEKTSGGLAMDCINKYVGKKRLVFGFQFQ
ncbi:hypothetical protein, partial [Neisseria weaveri]|uniref:hypothetical protein n=1 Tax=Neisseria weaveri TaxID=28091 RepID=UPI0019D399A2